MLSPTISVAPSAVMTVPFGKPRSSAATRTRTVGLHEDQAGRRGLVAAVHVEAEVADVRAAVRVDHHVVARAGRERREVGVLDEPLALESEHAAVEHRHDEHPAVGQPAEARRLLRHLDDRSPPCRRVHRDDAVIVLVAEVQPPVVPARSLGEHETFEQDRGQCERVMGRGPYSSGGRASVGLTSSSSLRARLGEQRHER